MRIVLVVIIIVAIFGLVGYFIMNNMNSNIATDNTYTPVPASALPSAAPVSEEEDTDTLQQELENTTSGSVEIEL